MLANLLLLSSKFVALLSAYAKLFIDLLMHIICHVNIATCTCDVFKVACHSYYIIYTPSSLATQYSDKIRLPISVGPRSDSPSNEK